MHPQKKAIRDEACKHCPARLDSGDAIEIAGLLSVVPSHFAAQLTDGVWNAVVHTVGKGTFLVRRPQNLPADACPLRAYEVRCIPADSPSAAGDEENAPKSAGAEFSHTMAAIESRREAMRRIQTSKGSRK